MLVDDYTTQSDVCLMLGDGYTIVYMIVSCRFSLQIAAHITRHSC